MANIASAKKQARASLRRAAANRAVRSAVKTRIVKARKALEESPESAAEAALTAVSSLDRAAAKGVLHRNNAARRKSRLMQKLGAASAPRADAPAKPAKAAKSTKAARTTTKKAPARKTTAKKG
jgi:small subunit ribosomal protein S20